MELIIIFVIVVIFAIWIGATIGGIVILLPALIVVGIGQQLGLNWWQSLLAAVFTVAIAPVMAEYYYARHFKKHAAELNLPIDFIGRQIEIEGKLATILGTTGKKVVIRKKGDIFARKIDHHLARTKAGL